MKCHFSPNVPMISPSQCRGFRSTVAACCYTCLPFTQLPVILASGSTEQQAQCFQPAHPVSHLNAFNLLDSATGFNLLNSESCTPETEAYAIECQLVPLRNNQVSRVQRGRIGQSISAPVETATIANALIPNEALGNRLCLYLWAVRLCTHSEELNTSQGLTSKQWDVIISLYNPSFPRDDIRQSSTFTAGLCPKDGVVSQPPMIRHLMSKINQQS